jgi:hypothetical protein
MLHWTALVVAASKNDSAAIEVLLKHGVNPNARDEEGDTALYWAAQERAGPKVFELLLDHKADPNVKNNYGKTPLDMIKRWLDEAARGMIHSAGVPGADANEIAALLRQHGALDKLPDWDQIELSRPSDNILDTVFRKGTNDWNRFSLLETIFQYYSPLPKAASSNPQPPSMPSFHEGPRSLPLRTLTFPGSTPMGQWLQFPDLTRVVIVRPIHGSTNATRITVNLLNGANEIDCAKDVALEFGDVVEIPQRDHPLGDTPAGITQDQCDTIHNYLKGTVQLAASGLKWEFPISPSDNTLGALLNSKLARRLLRSSSDLSRLKVTRRDPKTGKAREWILDCSHPDSLPDLVLRNGDVLEVPDRK